MSFKEETKNSILIEKTAEYVAKLGENFIDILKNKYSNEPTYKFLYPTSSDYNKFMDRIEYYKKLNKIQPAKTSKFSIFSSRINILIAKDENLVKTPEKSENSAENIRPRRKFQDEDIPVGIMSTLIKMSQENLTNLNKGEAVIL